VAPSPYRKPAPVQTDVKDRLECWLRDGDKHRWVRALYVKGWLTIALCTFLATSEARLAAIPLALIGLLWMLGEYRKRKGANVVFRVRTGRLSIARALGDRELSLDELHDVRLDTRTTSKNLTVARADGVNTVFGAASNHNIELDQSRIELVIDGEDPILLDREFISSSLCAEEHRAIRLFLRAHGWKPLDERSAGRLDDPPPPDRH